jgi:hypothetical protein
MLEEFSIIRRNNVISNTNNHEEFINDKAGRQLSLPYQPSSGHKYNNTEGLSVNYRTVPSGIP